MNTRSFNPMRLLSQALAAVIIVTLLLSAMPVLMAQAKPLEAPITFIGNIGTAQSKTTGTTLVITTTAAVTAGDAIFVAFVADDTGSDIVSVTDQVGNAYTQIAFEENGGDIRSYVYANFNAIALPAGNTITITHASMTARAATASVFRGLHLTAAAAVDEYADDNGGGTNPNSSATGTTDQADELLIGIVGTEGPSGDTAGTWQNSFIDGPRTGTTGGTADTNLTVSFGYRIVSATGSYTAAKTGATSRDWAAAIVTLRRYFAPTTTVVTSSLNPSISGQQVDFTATVTSATAGTISGIVTFRDGATTLGTGTISGGVATFSTSALTVGSHNITAVYGGDADFAGSTSAILVQNVNQAPAITSGNSATFSVGTAGTFDVNATGFPAPTYSLTGQPAWVTINATTGVFGGTPPSGSVGVYNFTVTAANGVSPDATQTFTLTVIPGNQTINFPAISSPRPYGSTFTINPTASSGLPVTVVATGVCTLVGNTVTMTSGTGTCTLTASQAGDASYNPAPDVVRTVAASRAATTVSVDPSPHTVLNPSQSFYSHPMTFTVTVSSTAGIPTGTVTLTGGTPAQNISATLDASGVALITTSNLNVITLLGAPVPHGLTVSYSGDANFNTDSEAVSHTILPAPTQVVVTSDINPSAEGQMVTFTVTVSPTAPGTGIPPGTVTLWDGSTQIGTATVLSGGVATFNISTLAFGSHNISARFVNSNDNYATSNNTANPYIQNVRRSTTTDLTSNNNPSIYGENVTFTATITSGTSGAITGTVTFLDGATTIGTDTTIVGGEATFTTNSLVVGTHPITAVYSGDGTFATSTSNVVNQVVNKATLNVTADPQTITYGDADPLFTFQYAGFVLGDDANDIDTPPTCDATTPHVNAGTYPGIITCSGGLDDNYDFNYIDGTLTVSQKALTITADNQGKIYGTTFTFTGTEFTTTGLIFADTVTSVTLTSAGAIDTAAVGTYPIVPGNASGSGLGNYAITYVNGTMTVAANALTIFANNQTKTYGDVFTFAGTEFTVVGLQPGDSVTSVTLTSAGAPSAANVGTYPIVPSAAVGTGLGNYTIVYSNGQMDVNQRNLTFNPDNQTKIYGSVFTGYTGTFTGLRAGDNITPNYDSLGAPATATVGVYDITVTLNDPDGRLGNYIVTIDPAPTATLTVTQRTLTATPDNKSKEYGDVFTAFTGTISGIQNGDNITASYSSPGAPAAAAVGTHDITVTLSDPDGMLGNYAVTLNTGTLTVTRRSLTAISDSHSKVYGDIFTTFTGSFTGIQNGDNITAVYDSLGAPATAPFGSYPITITLVDPDNKLGNYTVTQNVGTLTVNRRDLSFIADDKSKIYGDTFTAFTGSVTGLQNGDAITPIYSSPGAIATAPVGDYPITITLSDPTNKLGNYNFTIGTATLSVMQRDLIVTPDNQSKQYGTWFIAFTGTITGIQNGDNITANYASAGSPPSAAVGTYDITATLNDPTGKLGNYNVTLNIGTLTVGSSTLTVTANNQTIAYGSPDPTFTFTYTGFAAGDDPSVINTPPTCTVSGPHTDVGTYPIVCSGASDDAYTFIYANGTLTVTQRALIVTPTDKTKVYGDVFTAFTGTISGIQFGDNITANYASTGAPAAATVGDYPITATLNDPDNKLGNYAVTLNTGTLSVTPRALTVTPADKTKIYGSAFTAFTGTITGVQAADTITVTYDSPGAPPAAAIGDYPINATLNDPGNRLSNYTVTLNVGTLSVTPRALVVTPDNKSKVFGTVFTAFTGTISGIQNGDNITASYASAGAPAAAPVGTYPITATLNDPDNKLPNYTVTLNTGTLSVGLSVLTVTADNQTMVYGNPDPVFTFVYSGFASGDTPAVIDTPPTCQVAVPHNNIGTFPITCSGGIDDNYIFSYVPGTLTVTPRALTVTPDNKTKTFGDTFTAFTGAITGIQGGDIITATYASAGAPATAGIGSYPITATLNDPGGRLGNYTITLNTGTLTVNTRALLVTPTNASKVYGSVFTSFTGTIVGIQNGDPITATYASPGSVATATVGTYNITATLNAPAGVLNNYSVTSNIGTLTVVQRDLTVTPADKSKVYGTVFTAFTGAITGIQNSDPITATYSSPGAPAAAAVGDYPITATLNDPGGRLPNYNVSLGTGTLTVNQASPITGLTSDNNPAGVGDPVTFTATVTSSAGTPTGTITFFNGANSMGTVVLTGGVATLSTSTLPAGTHTITAVYSGDLNFSGTTSAPYVQGVGQTVTTTVVTSNNNPSVLGQSVTFTAIVSSLTGVPTGMVTFNDGATAMGTGTLNAGAATFTTNALTSGAHNITASYGGDPDFFGSVSPVLTHVVIPNTIIDTNPPDPDNDLTPTFTFSSTSATGTFVCRIDGAPFAPCNSGNTFGPLAAGNHTFEVSAIDSFGNTDPTPASYTWTIDTTAPDTDIDSTPPVITNIVDAAFTFSSQAADLASFECQLDGGGFAACTSPQNYIGLSAGPHLFEVRAIDVAGNPDPSPAFFNWMIDLGFPTVIGSSPSDNGTANRGLTQISVTFSKDVKNDGSAGAANLVANYLLVDDGPNDTFDTVSCLGGLVADDIAIPMSIPIYTNGTGVGPFTATSTINGGVGLLDGVYRLFVCGTTSIEDLAGNKLNDGLNDTIITFTVQRGGGGGGGNTVRNQLGGLFIPVTGFPQGETTTLAEQPRDKQYTATNVWMEIPRLKVRLQIVGVPQTINGWDVSWLGNNAGWLNGSAFPGWDGNSVITAHVWDAANNPGPFAGLINLQYGDQIKIHSFGQVYTYEVSYSTVILPSNISTAFKHEETPWLTLITCENYQERTETYTHRRLLRAVLVSVTSEK